MKTGREGFGIWLKKELKEHGYRQNSFAEMVGVNFRTVNHWCKGQNYPENEIHSNIDKALGKEIGYVNTVINKYRNEEKGISENDFDVVLNMVRELKKKVIEEATGNSDASDAIDFEGTIDLYRTRLVKSYKRDSEMPSEFLERLDKISNLDIYVYLFLSSANKDFKFEEYVNRFIFAPNSVRLSTYYGRVKKMIERDDK